MYVNISISMMLSTGSSVPVDIENFPYYTQSSHYQCPYLSPTIVLLCLSFLCTLLCCTCVLSQLHAYPCGYPLLKNARLAHIFFAGCSHYFFSVFVYSLLSPHLLQCSYNYDRTRRSRAIAFQGLDPDQCFLSVCVCGSSCSLCSIVRSIVLQRRTYLMY